MRLTTAELAELPLPAQWLDDTGNEVAQTPEWSGGGPDTTQYHSGGLRLLVETAPRSTSLALLCDYVLRELDALVDGRDGDLQLHRCALRAAMRLVMGRADLTERSTVDVLATLRASAAEENVTVSVAGGGTDLLRGGDTVALALKQLATNAVKHDGATDIVASADTAGIFRVQWCGSGTTATVRTSRHPDARARWGLGMVRLASDALGASVLPLRQRPDGRCEAAIEVPTTMTAQLTLPLAAVDGDGRVARATRAWDEEADAPLGSRLPADLAGLVDAAHHAHGRITAAGSHVARAGQRHTWVALRPRSHRDQARDLVAGLVHEKALVGDGVDATRLSGSCAALGLALGNPAELWLRGAAEERLESACAAFAAEPPVVRGDSTVFPPPALVAFLTSMSGGGELRVSADGWALRPLSPSAALADLVVGDVIPLCGASALAGDIARGRRPGIAERRASAYVRTDGAPAVRPC